MLISVDTPESLVIGAGKWIQAPYAGTVCYELNFSCKEEYETTINLAAESNFFLHLDGQFAGRNRMHATCSRCFLESFRLKTGIGMHRLAISIFDYGTHAPRNQVSSRNGFFCFSEDGYFNTGFASWTCRPLPQYRFEAIRLPYYHCAGGTCVQDNRIAKSSITDPPLICEPGLASEGLTQKDCKWRCLSPAPLPPFPEPEIQGVRVRCCIDGDTEMYPSDQESELIFPLFIPSRTRRRILLEFLNYECLNLTLRTVGKCGGKVTMSWNESLFEDPECLVKGNRRDVSGKFFHGLKDVFYPGNGSSEFITPRYRAGKFLEILIETDAEPFTIEQIIFRSSRYPLPEIPCPEKIPEEYRFLWKCGVRTLEMCCHDTLVDCPYYEQLQYIGDGRLMLQVLQTVSVDLRLNDHTLLTWAESRFPDGRIPSFAPSRTQQYIPGYALIFVLAVCDRLRDPRPCRLEKMLFRTALETLLLFEENVEEDGLLHLRSGWCFMDWVDSWNRGVPPMTDGISGCHNALYLYTLRTFEKLCRSREEKELAERFSSRSDALALAMRQRLYDINSGLYRETPESDVFSEHCGVLMILAGESSLADKLFGFEKGIAQCSFYFDAYYLQATLQTGHRKIFSNRLKRWRRLEDSGLQTLPETEDPSRSDCHGWNCFILRLLLLFYK